MKKYVNDMPFAYEAMKKKLINYGSLAELLKPRIEEELDKQVKTSAVMMALRRYADEMTKKYDSKDMQKVFEHDTELTMKSGLCDITVHKSPSLFGKLKSIYNLIDYEKGDILNIVHGHINVSIISNEKHKKKLLELLKDEKITHIEENLNQLSLKFSEDFLYTPGILYQMTKELLWKNVNLIEIVSSLTELNFLVKRKDAARGYEALENLLMRSSET
ncbi:MAG: hypothetical protein HYT70_01470 [Candidatus Aenigmarchaeota archaeon]|nr:hypothetical protein [Candidatus Aenigmarchaeota archaeon]